MLGGSLPLVPRVTGEVNLRIGQLDRFDGLVDRHVAQGRTAARRSSKRTISGEFVRRHASCFVGVSSVTPRDANRYQAVGIGPKATRLPSPLAKGMAASMCLVALA